MSSIFFGIETTPANTPILRGIMVLVAGLAFPPLASAATAYPNITITEREGGSQVYWDDKLIVDIRQNRYLRFRATPLNEKWVGNEARSADLGWAYRDEKAKGLEPVSTRHENNPGEGRFVLRLFGRKPGFESRNDVVLTGTWMPGERQFKYTLATSFATRLEDWYKNTSYPSRRWIEALDYCIEYVSAPERIMSKTHKEPQMYDWFVRSQNGVDFLKFPKTHIPYPTRRGNYITIRDESRPLLAGGAYGFMDRNYGGWLMRVEKTPAPVDIEVCWARFDLHVLLRDALPPPGAAGDLKLELVLAFEPVEPGRAEKILRAAEEVDWRSGEEYKLPLFTRDSRFDVLLTDLPGEDVGKRYTWWASSYECHRDNTIGFDDHYSVTIKRTKESPQPAAWSNFTWVHPFVPGSFRNRRFRLSAMVKTSECTGPVRLGFATRGLDIYYGSRTHNGDGTPKTDEIKWQFSEALTGTRDWTPLSMEFTITDNISMVFLEQSGTGQSWFDNVKIEELGKTVR